MTMVVRGFAGPTPALAGELEDGLHAGSSPARTREREKQDRAVIDTFPLVFR
jgi:hypothetical protein